MANNKISYISTIIKQLHEENVNPTTMDFVVQGEVFSISPKNIVQYFIDYNIDQKITII